MVQKRWAAENKKTFHPYTQGRKETFRGTTRDSCRFQACAFHPLTEMTRPHISLRKLPGEQNDTYRTGFQPMTDPLCCMQTRLFSNSTLVLYIYNIEKDRMQEGIEAGRKSAAGMTCGAF